MRFFPFTGLAYRATVTSRNGGAASNPCGACCVCQDCIRSCSSDCPVRGRVRERERERESEGGRERREGGREGEREGGREGGERVRETEDTQGGRRMAEGQRLLPLHPKPFWLGLITQCCQGDVGKPSMARQGHSKHFWYLLRLRFRPLYSYLIRNTNPKNL